MVVKILAYTREVVDNWDSEIPKVIGRTHSGQHQQLWRSHSSGGKDDLCTCTRIDRLPPVLIANANRAVTFE